jgi:hypothetical protein
MSRFHAIKMVHLDIEKNYAIHRSVVVDDFFTIGE